MNKTKREIDCLTRLQSLTGQLDDILDFLKLEDLINDGEIKFIRNSSDKAKEVQIFLKDLQVRQKVQMLMYEWSILPIENISITIITDKNQREFIYQG